MKIGRRSFVKGSVAAPLILTVGPAAAAARSSSQACLNRDTDRAMSGASKPVAMVSVDNDDWLRVKIDLLELSVWQDQALKTIAGKYFLGVDKSTYWLLDETLPSQPTATASKYNTGNCTARKLGQQRFALVYVDPRGNQTGYAFEANGGTPVTGSCWTSVAVTRA